MVRNRVERAKEKEGEQIEMKGVKRRRMVFGFTSD